VVLRAAVLAGLGIARLPESVVREDLGRDVLRRVLPHGQSAGALSTSCFRPGAALLPAVCGSLIFWGALCDCARFSDSCRAGLSDRRFMLIPGCSSSEHNSTHFVQGIGDF